MASSLGPLPSSVHRSRATRTGTELVQYNACAQARRRRYRAERTASRFASSCRLCCPPVSLVRQSIRSGVEAIDWKQSLCVGKYGSVHYDLRARLAAPGGALLCSETLTVRQELNAAAYSKFLRPAEISLRRTFAGKGMKSMSAGTVLAPPPPLPPPPPRRFLFPQSFTSLGSRVHSRCSLSRAGPIEARFVANKMGFACGEEIAVAGKVCAADIVSYVRRGRGVECIAWCARRFSTIVQ